MSFPIHKRKHQIRSAHAFSADRAERYDREAELPKLIGLWPHEVRDPAVGAVERIVKLLRKALRAERRRGQAGHWTYDLTRHLALSDALKKEEARLAALHKTGGPRQSAAALSEADGSAGVLLTAAAQLVSDADG